MWRRRLLHKLVSQSFLYQFDTGFHIVVGLDPETIEVLKVVDDNRCELDLAPPASPPPGHFSKLVETMQALNAPAPAQ